jgi:hypothetical protein
LGLGIRDAQSGWLIAEITLRACVVSTPCVKSDEAEFVRIPMVDASQRNSHEFRYR